MRRRTLGALAAALGLFVATLSTVAAQPTPRRFELWTHTLVADGAPVVADAWLSERVERASALFAQTSIAFAHVNRPLEGVAPIVANRAERNDLLPHARPGVINVFVVARLADIDAHGYRMGVHWRPPQGRGAHYIIISSEAAPTTLAHELGHFFGLPHSDTRNNLMSYSRDGVTPPFLDPTQLRRIRARARSEPLR